METESPTVPSFIRTLVVSRGTPTEIGAPVSISDALFRKSMHMSAFLMVFPTDAPAKKEEEKEPWQYD